VWGVGMSTTETPRAVAYVDGGCSPNPGFAAWAAVVITGDLTREILGVEENSTSPRAEVLAAIAALEALREPNEVEIVSDSMYLIQCGSGQWSRNTNGDLWKRLDDAAAPHRVTYRWVRGHNGHPGNERAHGLVEWLLEARDCPRTLAARLGEWICKEDEAA
jgi:ribonuclease HI